MGFGYNTSWIAVRDRTVHEIAAALELTDCEEVDWDEGTRRAYSAGVFVAGPVRGWTLAHSQWSLPSGFDATSARFPAWLSTLSRQLGVVQFFANFRGNGYLAWAWAADGEILRGHSIGDGEHYWRVGDRTDTEEAIRDVAHEDLVLAVAGGWSLNPVTLDGPAGLHGNPPQEPLSPQIVAARAYVAEVRRKRGI
jgi:hypothetical protein